MKNLLFLLLFSYFNFSYAQIQFNEDLTAPFIDVRNGSVSSSDIDNDGDIDIFITGQTLVPDGTFFNSVPISKLYLNDGLGNFTEDVSNIFTGVLFSSSAIFDINGDNYDDIIIAGLNNTGNQISQIYQNDGSGNFTVIPSSISNIIDGSLSYSDVDGDTDIDLLVTGRSLVGINYVRIANLYLNDGMGNFTLDSSTPFPGVEDSASTFVDVDNDSDFDLVITGYTDFGSGTSRLYKNDGMGNFTTTAFFDGVFESSIAIADIDNDNDIDIAIAGKKSLTNSLNLYINDGSGNFTETSIVGGEEVRLASISFSDVDLDNDPDLLISGLNNSSQPVTRLYINDGSGIYSDFTPSPFENVYRSALEFIDVNNDSKDDVIITGQPAGSNNSTKLYINQSIIPTIWTGTVDNNWNNALNWNSSTIPTTTDDVVISLSVNNPVIGPSTTAEISSLNINTDAELYVEGILKINNNLLNNGILYFTSNGLTTGQFDTFLGIYSGSGNVTTEHFIPANRAFRLLSSPVSTIDNIFENWQENGSTPALPDGLGTHITGGSSSDGFDQSGTNNPSMFTFNNAYVDPLGGADQSDGWQQVTSTNQVGDNLNTETPYLLFVRGDRSIDLTDNSSPANNTTLRATGELYTSSNSIQSLSNQSEYFSLVANPFQAMVDFNALSFTGLGNSNFLYVYDPTQKDYETLETGIDDLNMFVKPGQSFFVVNQAGTATASTIEFEQTDINTSATPTTTVFNNDHIEMLELKLYNGSNDLKENLRIRFEDNASNNVDSFDAPKLQGNAENLASLNAGTLYTIERRTSVQDTDMVPLHLDQYQGTNYEFRVKLENWNPNIDLFIEDNYLNSFTTITPNQAYNFSVDQNIPESIASDRFSIVFDNTTLGTEENTFGAGFNLYPNPTKDGHFSIKTPNLSGEVIVKLNNMLGQQVMNKTLTVVSNEVNVYAEGLSTGVYVVKLTQEEQTFSTKLIVE